MLLTTALALFVAGAALAADPTPPRAPDKPIPAAEDQVREAAAFGPQSAAQAIPLENLPADADKSAATDLRPAMLEELRIAREEEVRRVTELTTSLASASSPDRQFELQRQISAAKSDAHLQTMTIQLDYARRGGQQELAQRLEADIAQFETLRDAPRAPISTETVRDSQVSGGAAR
jgi:hypothetical protein